VISRVPPEIFEGMNLKKYWVAATQIFFWAGAHFFLIYLRNPAFSQLATLKKFRLNSTLLFQGNKSTNLFKTKNRVQNKRVTVAYWTKSFAMTIILHFLFSGMEKLCMILT
jgi:hypothetical protein